MPMPAGDPKERVEVDRCFRTKDIVPVSFQGTATAPSGTSILAAATYLLNQNYFLAGIDMAGAAVMDSGATAQGPAWVSLAKGNSGLRAGGATPQQNILGTIIVNQTRVDTTNTPFNWAAPSPVGKFLNFHPFGFYLPQGTQLKVLLGAGSNSVEVYYSVTAYLLPMFV